MNTRFFILCLMFGFLTHIPSVALCENQDESDLFRQTCATLAQDADKTSSMAVAGKDNWFFLASELRHLGTGQFWDKAAASTGRADEVRSVPSPPRLGSAKAGPDTADPLPVILDFNDQLKKIGVELIIIPVPPKAVIYPDMLPGFTNRNTSTRLDRVHQKFYTLLRSKGIKVLDLTDFFLQNKNHSQGPLYCRQDSHWSGNGCVLAAEKIAAEIRPVPLINARQKQSFTSDWQIIEINGDLRPGLKIENIPREKLNIRKISNPGSNEPIGPANDSGIILLGDSHNLVFHAGEDMLAGGAGLPDQLAFELGSPVELVAVRGSGATPARINLMRRARQKEDYWKNKKCVIWCFSAREFTESDGWRKVLISAPQSK